MERWLIFNPVKELEKNNRLYSFWYGAKLFNNKFIKCLQYLGCSVDENVDIYISPSTAINCLDYKKHFSKNISIINNSSLQLYGNIYVRKLYLKGKLTIIAKEGVKVKFGAIIINNNRNVELNCNKDMQFNNFEFC